MKDVDGVLVCGRPSDGRGWKTDLHADLGLTAKDLRAHFFAPFWAEIVTGQRALRDTLATVLPAFAPDISAADLITYWFQNDARLDVPLLAALAEARSHGLSVWLATNQDHERAQYLWRDLGLRDHADGMIWSARLGVAKPNPAFFRLAAQAAGAKKNACLLVDDSSENVTAARQAGWQGVHWDGHTTWADVLDKC